MSRPAAVPSPSNSDSSHYADEAEFINRHRPSPPPIARDSVIFTNSTPSIYLVAERALPLALARTSIT